MANKFYNNLVSHWLMNDDLATTAVLDTTGVNDGVMNVNTDTKSVEGKINKALDFDGTDDYVDCGANVIPTGDFTLSAWVYLNNLTSYQAILGQYQSGESGRLHFLIEQTSGKIFLQLTSTETSDSGITASEWHHIVVTRSGSTVRFYIDGVADGTATLSDNVLQAVNTKIGISGVNKMDGKIDDVRIYDTAISPYYIKLLYNNGAGTEDENVQSNTLLLGCNF